MSAAQFHEAMESNNVGQKLSVAQQETDPARKRSLLDSVIENLIKDSSAVLDNYQDEICQFCNDPHYIVRIATIRRVSIFFSLRQLYTLHTVEVEAPKDLSFMQYQLIWIQ